LCAEADAIDAVLAEEGGAGGVEGVGVGFDGEFGKVLGGDGGVDKGHKSLQALGIEEGWGAAADEDGLRGKRAEVLEVEGDFAFEGIKECVGLIEVSGERIEVAVVTFGGAEGDVDIEGLDRLAGATEQGRKCAKGREDRWLWRAELREVGSGHIRFPEVLRCFAARSDFP
jgi:hypothetical protein